MAFTTELDDRISKCNKILDENPNSQIFAALAEAYRKKGELDKAFRVCQNGLRVHPNYGSAHMVMAKINFDKGLYDWAELEVQKAIELEGSSHASDLLLAEIYIYKGEFAKATKILNRLHSADTSNQQVLKLLEIAKKLPLESARKIEGTAHVESKATPISPALEPAVDRISMNQFLNHMMEISGVEGVLLIHKDGLVADSRWDNPQDRDLYGALAGDIERTIKAQLGNSPFGKYENVLVEAGDLIVNLLPLGGSFLLIRANKQINLGTLRLKMTALLRRLDLEYN
ncbi:MAG: hypothetical protein HRF51_11765 [bacterium]|jgi:predicted regulator of Ras-like GTPase activity (Roadblock/LC7/MglB family)